MKVLVFGSVVCCLLSVVLVSAPADTIPTPLRYDVERSRPGKIAITPRRGECFDLQIRYTDYGSAVDLSSAYSVFFNYRPSGSTNVYAIQGRFIDRTNGLVGATWMSSNELVNSSYTWDVIVSGATTAMNRAWGTLAFADNVGYQASTNTPTPISVIDFATAQLLNTASSPFLMVPPDGTSLIVSNGYLTVISAVSSDPTARSNITAHAAESIVTAHPGGAALATYSALSLSSEAVRAASYPLAHGQAASNLAAAAVTYSALNSSSEAVRAASYPLAHGQAASNLAAAAVTYSALSSSSEAVRAASYPLAAGQAASNLAAAAVTYSALSSSSEAVRAASYPLAAGQAASNLAAAAVTNININGTVFTVSGGMATGTLSIGGVAAWNAPTVIYSAPTTTIQYANGPYQSLDLTNNTYLTLSTNAMPRAGRSEIELGINIRAYSLTFDTSIFDTNGLASSLAANYWYTLRANKGPNQSMWRLTSWGTAFSTPAALPLASGGILTTYTEAGTGYRYNVHCFSNFVGSTNFSVTTGGPFEVLLIAGGGGGGSGGTAVGFGGGGAGGYIYTQQLTLASGSNYTLSIGGGGAGQQNGTNTTGFGLTAVGGGCGARYDSAGGTGGSGGGGAGAGNIAGRAGTAGQGNAGGSSPADGQYQSGGGGGGASAGEAGSASHGGNRTPGYGGTGVVCSVTGTATYYCGGGGGGADESAGRSQAKALGGLGGGGDGEWGGTAGQPGADGFGGGGGGGGLNNVTGGRGGNGAVYIRYRIE